MLSGFLKHQIDFLLLLQNFRETTNGFFDNFFLFITKFGEITIPILILAGIYWCINSKYGMYVMWSWGLGLFGSEFIKSSVCIYRPWILDDKIHPLEKALSMAGGYSFPSGHTQTAVTVWGGIANCFKNKFLTLFCICLIILVGFSRNYAGVHTPQDVIFAVFFGIFMLFLTKKLMLWEEKSKNRDIVIFLSVVILAVLLILYEYFKAYPMDYINNVLIVDPAKMRIFVFPKIGILLGIFSGWFLNKRLLNFDGSKGTVCAKIIRYSIGVFFLLLLYNHTKVFLEFFIIKQFTMFFSAFLSGIFVTFIYPAIITYFSKFYNLFKNRNQ